MSKHSELQDWIQPFLTNNHLYFENIEMVAGYRTIVPQYGDYLIKLDVLGRKYKQYTFAFVGVETYDASGTSDQNTNNMALFDLFNEWLIQQQELRNFPDFGANVTEYNIEPLQNMANLTQYDESTQTAKYMLGCNITYVEGEE